MQKVLREKPAAPTVEAKPELRLGTVEWVMLAIHSMFWGSAFFFVDVAKNELSAFAISTLRVAPAALVLGIVTTILGQSVAPVFRDWRRFVVLGFLNNFLPILLIIYGQYQVPGGMAAVLNATSPLFAALLAHFATHDEKLTWNKTLGIAIGIAGVGMIAADDLRAGSSAGLLAILALIGAAFCYALAGIYGRTFRGVPPFVIALGQMVWAFVWSIPTLVLFGQPEKIASASTASIAACIASGIIASAFASMFYFTILRRAGATNALLVTLLLPLTPITLGWIFLGQTLKPTDVAGAIVIAFALIVIDGRLLRRLMR